VPKEESAQVGVERLAADEHGSTDDVTPPSQWFGSNMDSVETILCEGETIALIVRSEYQTEGITFFTPGTFSQQLGYMNRPAGHVIDPHVHLPVKREVSLTKEVLFIRRGSLRVDFYSDAEVYLESRVLKTGDVILLIKGGHGFEMLEDTEMIEVKQGPYAGDQDKRRFTPSHRT